MLSCGWAMPERPNRRRGGHVAGHSPTLKPDNVPVLDPNASVSTESLEHCDKQVASRVFLLASNATCRPCCKPPPASKADLAADRRMSSDDLFWIASMTKRRSPASAVMMMQDEGKLRVDDLVEKYIPEFADLKTTEGKPAKITIRHLLTHTSGLAEMSGSGSRPVKTLAVAIPYYVNRPVAFDTWLEVGLLARSNATPRASR